MTNKNWRPAFGSLLRRLRWLVPIGLGAAWLASAAGSAPLRGQSELAFAIDYVEISSNTVTGRALKRDLTFARRHDGAEVKTFTGAQVNRRDLTFPLQGLRVVLSDSERVKTTYDYSEKIRGKRLRRRSADCSELAAAGYELLGRETVSGFSTLHFRKGGFENADGERIVIDRWLSPTLNCTELQTKAVWRDVNDAVTSVFEKKPLRVTVGNVPEALFRTNADYQEIRPSKLEERLVRAKVREDRGHAAASAFAPSEKDLKLYSKLDKDYEDAKRK